ncbi:MAG: DNA polymerase II [Gammaproteobacteria bacterium]|nr:DNA polymerase II [Gammaproteobacteria bacterium]
MRSAGLEVTLDSAVDVETSDTPGFILTRQWQEHEDGQDLIFWLVTDYGPLRVVVEQQPSVFFIAESKLNQVIKLLSDIDGWRQEHIDLQTFIDRERVVACYFQQQRDLYFARSRLAQANIPVFEDDIRPTDRYLMERFVTGSAAVKGRIVPGDRACSCINPKIVSAEYSPELHVISLDIETSVTDNVVLSIAVYSDLEQRVFMVSDTRVSTDHGHVECLEDEKSLLLRFLKWVEESDPDVIIGWNVVGFDLNFLQERCTALKIDFRLGRSSEMVIWRSATRGRGRNFALVPGRVVLDGIELLRTATWSFESFSLEFVARELLGRGKLVNDVDARAAEIEEMYADNRALLAEYNLQDCELVWDIFSKADLIEFAIERSRLTGLDLDRPGGSVAAFDFLYLPRLHREGFVAPSTGSGVTAGSPGGFVLESRAGLYEHVVVLDFKSLYPGIIRTFHVDPLAMITAGDDAIEGFRGGRFSRTRALLPGIIENLWQARDVAKKDGRSAMSQAIKIIMNSFYGVLGTSVCRFFDTRLASSITMRGHEILQRTRDLIEAKGLPVIYGDTDSVFVHMDSMPDVSTAARDLVTYLNTWWRDDLQRRFKIPCFLEVEFETHFEKFFMPAMRGSERGSKKRYAGLVTEEQGTRLIFKGLESVRSDWSPLAREFQQELYRRIFLDQPFEQYVKTVVEQVRHGQMDEHLVLRRRMRRRMKDYVKNVPPHVRAARSLSEIRASKGLPPLPDSGGWSEYVMTVNGPEPRQYVTSSIDYGFYVDRQLAPIADAILSFKGTSLAEITDQQMTLF